MDYRPLTVFSPPRYLGSIHSGSEGHDDQKLPRAYFLFEFKLTKRVIHQYSYVALGQTDTGVDLPISTNGSGA